MEQANMNKNITHELFEMVDGMSDQLSDKNIKDLKEKIGEVHHILNAQTNRISCENEPTFSQLTRSNRDMQMTQQQRQFRDDVRETDCEMIEILYHDLCVGVLGTTSTPHVFFFLVLPLCVAIYLSL